MTRFDERPPPVLLVLVLLCLLVYLVGGGAYCAPTESCACFLKENMNITLSCGSNAAKQVRDALEYLELPENGCDGEANATPSAASAASAGVSEECKIRFLVLQAHSDLCGGVVGHDAADATREYQNMGYQPCFVPRQLDIMAPDCPVLDCEDAAGIADAVEALESGNCASDCAAESCASAVRTLIMAYDNGCALPLKASLALRAVRAPCDRELCNTNTVGIAYDPNEEACD
mmetsp:Transcript_2486/g.8449  ORF Transcript_2486/g.8449 Transcript_2486/m.8449 type:complete len:232 (-) Transcript_2486:107-802(-)